jgi:hypothetical protein
MREGGEKKGAQEKTEKDESEGIVKRIHIRGNITRVSISNNL